MNVCPLSRIAAALERVADNMDAAMVLEERRRKNREHMATVRGKTVCTQTSVERNEEAKEEKSPHTPLKGESEEAKKELPSPHAHARGPALGGRGAANIRTCGKTARPQDDPDTRQKRIDRAKHLVMRKRPECLRTFWLILKNGKNRKESIWQLMKDMASK